MTPERLKLVEAVFEAADQLAARDIYPFPPDDRTPEAQRLKVALDAVKAHDAAANEKPIDRDEFYMLRDQGRAWMAVCGVLNELAPLWLGEQGNAIQAACTTIRKMHAAAQHKPLNLPADRTAMIERAMEADDGNCSTASPPAPAPVTRTLEERVAWLEKCAEVAERCIDDRASDIATLRREVDGLRATLETASAEAIRANVRITKLNIEQRLGEAKPAPAPAPPPARYEVVPNSDHKTWLIQPVGKYSITASIPWGTNGGKDASRKIALAVCERLNAMKEGQQ